MTPYASYPWDMMRLVPITPTVFCLNLTPPPEFRCGDWLELFVYTQAMEGPSFWRPSLSPVITTAALMHVHQADGRQEYTCALRAGGGILSVYLGEHEGVFAEDSVPLPDAIFEAIVSEMLTVYDRFYRDRADLLASPIP